MPFAKALPRRNRGRFNAPVYERKLAKRWRPVIRNAATHLLKELDKAGVLERYDEWFRQQHPRVTSKAAVPIDGEQFDIMADLLRAPYQRWWQSQKVLPAIAQDSVREVATAASKHAFSQLGFAVQWNMDSPFIAELTEQRLNMSVTMGDSVFNQVKSALIEQFYEKGAGPVDAEFLKTLQAKIPKSTEYIAERIARTETGVIQSQTQQKCWEANQVTHKRWHHSGGLDPREDHIALDGELVPIDEPFSNGLMHPHDPAGAAGDVINCRCYHSPVVTDEIYDRIAAEGVVNE